MYRISHVCVVYFVLSRTVIRSMLRHIPGRSRWGICLASLSEPLPPARRWHPVHLFFLLFYVCCYYSVFTRRGVFGTARGLTFTHCQKHKIKEGRRFCLAHANI